jgi:predicted nuclease with TOPRIM domain
MSANLETALTRYQHRTGLKPDGVVAPNGPTVQQIAAEAERGDPERSARAHVNDISENLADFQSTERLSEPAKKKAEHSNSAAILANNIAPTATDKKERDCSGIQTNLHEAHQHANTLSDLAKTKSTEIRDLRQSIAEFANLEEFINEQMLGEAIERALRRSPAGLIAFEIVDGIRNINTVKTAQNLTQRLQQLLDENALLHNDLEKQLEKVEQLRAKYNECLTRPAPEDGNETGPAVPTS